MNCFKRGYICLAKRSKTHTHKQSNEKRNETKWAMLPEGREREQERTSERKNERTKQTKMTEEESEKNRFVSSSPPTLPLSAFYSPALTRKTTNTNTQIHKQTPH